jgi:nucleotide-binding universal stress UspA family protein
MSTSFRSVGCCIDRSPAADLVIDEAIRLRRDGVAQELHLVHVVEPPPPLHAGPFTYIEPSPVLRREAQEWIEERLAAIPGADGVVLEGNPSDAVCAWAAEAGVDLLVVAPHHGAFARAVHGEFAGRVTYAAPCPVLMVRRAPAEG